MLLPLQCVADRRNLTSAGKKTPDDSCRVLQHLLLDHLADHHQQKDAALAESARSFLVCGMLAVEICSNQADATADTTQLLHQYHRLQQQAEVGTASALATGMQACTKRKIS